MMRRSIFFNFAVAVATVLFVACESDSDSEPTLQVASFEDATLNSTGFWNGSDRLGTVSVLDAWMGKDSVYSGYFSSNGLKFKNNFTYNTYYGSTSWSGFALSNHTDMDSIGYGNQYSVYANSGANGSAKFAIIYAWDSATCVFPQVVSINSLMINNSTYVYKAIKEGKDGFSGATKFVSGDYLFVTITGYGADSSKTASVDVPLAEFRNGESSICSAWKSVALSALGRVKSLSFKFTCSNTMVPTYCCIDNIAYFED
jgi:hypothetical protein